jgi:hypothetical protein
MMLDSVKRFIEEGATPVGLGVPVPYADLRAEEQMLPLDAAWQTVSAAGVEPVLVSS